MYSVIIQLRSMRYVNEMSKLYSTIVLLAVFCIAAGYPVDDDVKGEGVARQYRIAEEKYLNVVWNSKMEAYDAKKVKFYLYTKQQPEKVEIKHEDFELYLKNSTYDVSRPTKFFIHDRLFFESYYKELVMAYLRHFREPVNVITVDYSYYSGAEHKEFMQVYQEIGASVAKFIKELSHYGVSSKKIHIIGHGVGAHIAAVAARGVTPNKVGRITGLDPVGLEFDEDKNLPQLQKHDADFVDVIVTNANGIGSKGKARGHVNFYPNGGDTQPQSNYDDMLMSHLKSYFYYVESVSRGKVFEAYAADGYENFKADKYDHAKVNYMGEYTLKNENGDFYLNTNPVPPYSISTDSGYRFEETKFNKVYFNLILGTKLRPFIFMPKDDPYFKEAVMNQKILYNGFGEGPDKYNTDSKKYREEAHRYSTEPRY